MKHLQSYTLMLGVLILGLGTNSCVKESTGAVAETAKNVVGTWKITSVMRNGVDITSFFDFTQFNIQFKEDGTYLLSHPVPFVVSENGAWSLDDPTHPLRISFVQNGSAEVFNNEFNYPVVDGNRRIILTGAPGCRSNTYQYALMEVK